MPPSPPPTACIYAGWRFLARGGPRYCLWPPLALRRRRAYAGHFLSRTAQSRKDGDICRNGIRRRKDGQKSGACKRRRQEILPCLPSPALHRVRADGRGVFLRARRSSFGRHATSFLHVATHEKERTRITVNAIKSAFFDNIARRTLNFWMWKNK